MTLRSDFGELRCRGCLAFMGYGRPDMRVFHSMECVEDFPLKTTEQRDDLMAALFRAGVSPIAIGHLFGMTRQAAHLIINERLRVREP